MKLLGSEVPPLGMGCWAIGGQFFSGSQPHGFPEIDDDMSIRTIHAALDSGVRIFDTAPVYGAGHSEKILGEALRNQPDAIVITKFGTAFDEKSKQVLADEVTSESVEPAVEESLRRLQRDRIDIMLLHLNALPLQQAMPLFDALERMRQSGKIRTYGWSTDLPASANAMAKSDGFIGVEHAMSVFIEAQLMQACVEKNELIAFIRSPLAMGILTGKFTQQSTLPANDVRAVNSARRDYFHNRKVAAKYLAKLDAIRELLQSGGRSLSQGALGWLLAKSERNVPLPGARTVEQMQDNAGAIAFGALPTEVMTEIEALIEREPEGEPRPR